MAVTPDVSRAHVESEISELQPWVEQHGWKLDWSPAVLQLKIEMRSKIDGEIYFLEISFDDYRARPPYFEFLDPLSGERGSQRCYPGGGRGYFHNHPVICAPWNRKAYAAHGGPHGDWVMDGWATYRPNHARICDMLVLLQDLLDDASSYSGRMKK